MGRDEARLGPFALGSSLAVANAWGGKVVTQDNTDVTKFNVIKLFAGATAISASNPFPLGILREDGPLATQGAIVGGDGTVLPGDSMHAASVHGSDFTVFQTPGKYIDIFDGYQDFNLVPITSGVAPQNRSCPFDASVTFVAGDKVYADALGLLTNDNTGKTVLLGYVRAVSGDTGSKQRFTLQWSPQAI
jgi:hypothetical protein